MMFVSATMVGKFSIDKPRLWQNPWGNSLDMPCEVHSCLNGWQFIYKSTTLMINFMKNHKGCPLRAKYTSMFDNFFTNKPQNWKLNKKFMWDSLWGPYVPQWPTIYSKSNHIDEKTMTKKSLFPMKTISTYKDNTPKNIYLIHWYKMW